jgi:alkanesulfonate monooxygenase SsuD/methylene tetrahydromethanopterin reductase-like flavin-dependent oxidoreductase (luciferase family)
MRLSISLTNYSWRDLPLVDGLVRAAVTADQGGLDTVWVPDHLAQVDPTVPAEADDMLEAYGVLAYLAARTERVRLGALVTNVTLRPPGTRRCSTTTGIPSNDSSHPAHASSGRVAS